MVLLALHIARVEDTVNFCEVFLAGLKARNCVEDRSKWEDNFESCLRHWGWIGSDRDMTLRRAGSSVFVRKVNLLTKVGNVA